MAERFPGDGLLLAVADGMGGHAAGEVASALAVQTLLKAIQAGESLEDAVRLANWQVHKKAQDPNRHGMGTTLTVMYLRDDLFHLANVGDSRAYRVSRRGIRQLTEDHSFVAEAMKRGQPEEAAMASPWKDALTRSIGTDEDVEVDVFGPFPVEDDTAILICSDGLYKTLGRVEIWKIFMASEDLHEAARTLVSTAYENGSDDNITVAIAEFGSFPRRQAGKGPAPAVKVPMEERRGQREIRSKEMAGGSVVRGESEGGTGGRPGKEERPGGRPETKVPTGRRVGAEERREERVGPGEQTGAPTRVPERAERGIGGKSAKGGEMADNARDLGSTLRRQAVAPWELGSDGSPRIVGGPKRKPGLARSILFVSTVAVVVALAALWYFR